MKNSQKTKIQRVRSYFLRSIRSTILISGIAGGFLHCGTVSIHSDEPIKSDNLSKDQNPTKNIAQSPEKATNAEQYVGQLVHQLGSPVYRKREAAQKQLAIIGEPALPLLKIARKDGNLEIASRSRALIAIIEEESRIRKALIPTMVELHLNKSRLSLAIDELSKQSGIPLKLIPNKNQKKEELITLETGKVPFWLALEKLCEKANLVEVDGLLVRFPGSENQLFIDPASPFPNMPNMGLGRGWGATAPLFPIEVKPDPVLAPAPQENKKKSVPKKSVLESKSSSVQNENNLELTKKLNVSEKNSANNPSQKSINIPNLSSAQAAPNRSASISSSVKNMNKSVGDKKKQAKKISSESLNPVPPPKPVVVPMGPLVQGNIMQVQVLGGGGFQGGGIGNLGGLGGGFPGLIQGGPLGAPWRSLGSWNGIGNQPRTSTPIYLMKDRYCPRPIEIHGSVRVRALPDILLPNQAVYATNTPNSRTIHLQVQAEPNRPIEFVQYIDIFKAMDDQGQNVKVFTPENKIYTLPGLNNGVVPIGNYYPILPQEIVAPGESPFAVQFEKPAKESKMIKELRGEIAFFRRSAPQTLVRIDNFNPDQITIIEGEHNCSMKWTALKKLSEELYQIEVELTHPYNVFPKLEAKEMTPAIEKQDKRISIPKANNSAIPPVVKGVPAQPPVPTRRKSPRVTAQPNLFGISLFDSAGEELDFVQATQIFILSNDGINQKQKLFLVFSRSTTNKLPAKLIFQGTYPEQVKIKFKLNDIPWNR